MRIGVIGDSQINSTTDDGMNAVIGAFEILKTKGVDMVINVGDICDSNPSEIYPYYMQQFRNIFGEDVEHFAVPGNHDIWADSSLAVWKQYFGEPNYSATIGGFRFVRVASDGSDTNGNYGEETQSFARSRLQTAAAEAQGKPMFLITHQHLGGTVYGSDLWGNSFLKGIADEYENLVSLSGHSHFALEDERSIWQKNYTAIGTSSLSYTELEYGKENGSVPPEASECKQFLYIEIFTDRIEIERIKEQTGEQIKDKWVLALPLDKDTFTYTAARADSRTAPAFADGSELSAELKDGTGVTLSFPAATHDDFVHSYRVKLVKKVSGGYGELKNILIFSDFYKGLGNMADSVSYSFENVIEDYTQYRAEVYAIESFGKESEPLICYFDSIGEPEIPMMKLGNMFSIDFITGDARNAGGSLTVTRRGGAITLDSGMQVFDPQGSGKIVVGATNPMYTLTARKFTLEAAFRLRSATSEQVIVSCASNGGVSLSVTADGMLCFKARNTAGTDDTLLTYPITAGKEYRYAAVTYDGTTLKLYLDGTAVAEAAHAAPITYNRSVDYSVGSAVTGGSVFDGFIATAALNTSVKSADEIKTVYDTAVAGRKFDALRPIMEERYRAELLAKANGNVAGVGAVAVKYMAELTAMLGAWYRTEAATAAVVAPAELDAVITELGGQTELAEYTVPVIIGAVEGGRYDINKQLPTITWDAGVGTLNGEAVEQGFAITETGDYSLVVVNGWKVSNLNFEVYEGYKPPVISGIEDGATYDLYADGAPSISWTPDTLVGKLDSLTYTAGTPITELGWHTFMISDGVGSIIVYAFRIVDNSPAVSGVEDGEVYDLDETDPPAASWNFDATASLDGEEYAAGTPITEVGEHTLIVTDGNLIVFVIEFEITKAPDVMRGDFDKDGSITVADALAALRIAARLTDETADALLVGDIDGDGSITVADALSILRKAAQLIDVL